MTSSANRYYFISYQTVCLLLPLLTLIDWLELPALYEVDVVGVYISAQFSSVAQSCQTLCDPMDCSIADFPFHHQLLDPAQTHVHQVHDAIQPSHSLSSPSSPAFSIRVFSNESVFHIRWPKYWSFSFSISPSNEYSGLISFRTYWFDLLAV